MPGVLPLLLSFFNKIANGTTNVHSLLLLLDLNLPDVSGMDVLEELKRDPYFRQTPVIVLTLSLIHI